MAREPDLLDVYMPRYDVRTRYSVRVHASATGTFAALQETDLLAPWVVRALFALRMLPVHPRRLPTRPRIRTLKDLARGGALLDERPGREIVFGVIGKFWALRGRSHRPIIRESFVSFAEPGLAKAVLAFTVDTVDERACLVSTETRVACADASSRRVFAAYWWLIGPFSGLIRKAWLSEVRASAERARQLERRNVAIGSPRVAQKEREN